MQSSYLIYPKMKKVFIVGGTSGFGLALTKSFRRENIVYVCGRRKSNVENSIVLDMLSVSKRTFDEYNPEIIISNAFDKSQYIKSYEGSLNVLKSAMAYFKEKKGGTIIVVNSYYGLNPDTKAPDYAAAKHAIKGYVDSISLDAFLNNIRILNLYPRAMKNTGMNIGRSDSEDLIDPDEVADFVVTMTKTKSFYVGAIQFDRNKC